MKQIRCEVCGSIDLIKQDGLFVCQSCGIQYSLEEVKKLMVEGTVKIDKSDEVQNLLKRAQIHLENEDWENVDRCCDKALDIDSEIAEAYLYKLMAECEINNKCDLYMYQIIDSPNLHRAFQFGDESLKEWLKELINSNFSFFLEEDGSRVEILLEAGALWDEEWLFMSSTISILEKTWAFNHSEPHPQLIDYRARLEQAKAEFIASQKEYELRSQRRSKGLCQHCGGQFKGFFTQKCADCGREKDY